MYQEFKEWLLLLETSSLRKLSDSVALYKGYYDV